MEEMLHARRTDPRVPEWLDAAEPETSAETRMVELIDRDFRRASAVPSRLATEIARLTSLAHGIWADARAAEEADDFLPTLDEIVDISSVFGRTPERSVTQ